MRKKMIQEINSRKLRGTFVEIGCGMPVSNAILAVEGASNTVVSAICPYAREEQERLFGTDYPRSVSQEFVQKVIATQRAQYPDSKLHYVSSLQVGYDACSHGWVGIYYVDDKDGVEEIYYHITFNKGLTRPKMADEMCSFGLGLIGGKGLIIQDPLVNYTVDYSSEQGTYLLFAMKNNPKAVILYHPQHKRLEEYLRAQGDTVNLYKGSFNPYHPAHLDIASSVGEKDRCLFVISINTHEKGCGLETLMTRVKAINDLGYPVAVVTNPFFQDLIDLVRERGYKGKINMLMGHDTATRLHSMKNYKESDDVTFTYFDRGRGGKIPTAPKMFVYVDYDNPISSTALRAQQTNT
jgi:nicotinic acid mononucleotide adenylyltransferase